MKKNEKRRRASQETASFDAVDHRPVHGKSRKGGRTVGIIVGVLILALVVLFAIAAVTAGKMETVYPRVKLGGCALGGLSLSEAEESLQDQGWDNLDDAAVTVKLPGGSISVTYAQAGLQKNAEEAAQLAYDYGRNGNLFGNTITFMKSLVIGKDLSDEVFAAADKKAIADHVAAALIPIRAGLEENWTLDTEAQTLTVVKGASQIRLDEGEITELILKAIADRNFGTVTYTPNEDSENAADLAAFHDETVREMKDAYYDQETDSIVPEQVGIDFQIADVQEIWDAAKVGDTVVLPVTVSVPEETEEHLKSVLFHDTLASKSTSLKGSSGNRINNVELAAKALNGKVLMPGEQLSYNATLGQRTKESGYKEAGAYSNGAVVQEVGGGICQVSSTLYYCALLANLKIDYRVNHYFPVGYLPAGFDATVSWKSPDFKFTNDREYPIKLVAYVSGNSLTVEIQGTDDGTYVELSSNTALIYTNSKYPDTATGYKAWAYRSIYDSATGKLIEKKSEGVSIYHYHEENIKYPSPSPSVEPTPTPAPTHTPAPTPAPSTEPTPAPTPVPETTPEPAPAPDATEQPAE